MTESNLVGRSLVGLAIFAAIVALGVALAAGDQSTRRAPAGHLTTANTLSDPRSRRRAPDVASPRPNPRAHKPHGTAGRAKPL